MTRGDTFGLQRAAFAANVRPTIREVTSTNAIAGQLNIRKIQPPQAADAGPASSSANSDGANNKPGENAASIYSAAKVFGAGVVVSVVQRRSALDLVDESCQFSRPRANSPRPTCLDYLLQTREGIRQSIPRTAGRNDVNIIGGTFTWTRGDVQQ
jgi:hypothetical protein